MADILKVSKKRNLKLGKVTNNLKGKVYIELGNVIQLTLLFVMISKRKIKIGLY